MKEESELFLEKQMTWHVHWATRFNPDVALVVQQPTNFTIYGYKMVDVEDL